MERLRPLVAARLREGEPGGRYRANGRSITRLDALRRHGMTLDRAIAQPRSSFRDAPLGAGPESIFPAGVMDSELTRRLSSGTHSRDPLARPGMTIDGF
jgi:hypothetical protein